MQYSRRHFLRSIGLAAGALAMPRILRARKASATKPPNFVIIMTDDAGYADVGVYGAKDFQTPNLDRMAAEGVRFTDFYVAQPVCGASRAALLTGCYANRIGMLGAPGPRARHGINETEMTLGELVKQKGYATAIFGKWHLGDNPRFLPPRHGFDDYFGLPYSNDMWPHHPTNKRFPPLPLIEGEKVINPKVTGDDQKNLTTWYTERAVKFIAKNKDRPFLLYVPHSMPHVPLFVSGKFKGKSKQGLYGDVMMEIDWSVGQILKALKDSGVDENTLVMFTSDNGPWLSYGNHAGSAGPLREGKATTWDGGTRVFCLMRWPGRIPPGSICKEPAMTIDVFPTVAGLAGAALPKHKIDGKDIWPLISGKPGAKSPQEAYFFYWGNALEGVRAGRWKMHFPHGYRHVAQAGRDGRPGRYVAYKTGVVLYDLQSDPGEKDNVADKHPDVVERLKKLGEAHRKEIAANRRPPGRLQGGRKPK